MGNDKILLLLEQIEVSEETFKKMTKGFMELKDKFEDLRKIKLMCNNSLPYGTCKLFFNCGIIATMNLELEDRDEFTFKK